MFRISTANLTFKKIHLTCKNENRKKKQLPVKSSKILNTLKIKMKTARVVSFI